MAVGVEGVTDIDGRHSQGSRLEFNAPAMFVQGIKEIFSLRQRDPEGWVAVDPLWHARNRHMFLFVSCREKHSRGRRPWIRGRAVAAKIMADHVMKIRRTLTL